MQALRFFFVLALFAVSFSVFAQTDDDAVKEKSRRDAALLEAVLVDAKSLRLPENRASVYAKVGSALWQTDEKRARALFQNSIDDLVAAQAEAEAEKGINKQALNNLIYGQAPRWEILSTIANRDAEFALDALLKTRPPKVARAVAEFTGDHQSQSQQYARSEIQGEQRLIAQAAEQNPQRAAKLLRESLKKDVSYDTLNLLKRIYAKDPDAANDLADAVAEKLLAVKLDEENQDSGFIQYFLGEFGQEKPAEAAQLKISDRLLRDLAEKIVKFTFRPNATSLYMNPSALKAIERFFPAAAAQLKQRQAVFENQNAQNQNYSNLMRSETSTEELLSQAEKYPRSYRSEIYRRAAEKTAQSGNVAEAEKIITAHLSEEESERYLSQLNFNLATEAIGRGKFGEARQFINQMSDENNRLSALIYLATEIYQKSPADNQKWASSVLDEARSLISEAPEKTSEINSLVNVAAAYALIEPAQAFRSIESLTAPLNEFSEAAAVIAKFNDYGNFRRGEYQMNAGANLLNVYNLANVLQKLKSRDFDRTIRFIDGFSRLDVRLSLKIQLLDWNLPINSSGVKFAGINSLSRSGFMRDK